MSAQSHAIINDARMVFEPGAVRRPTTEPDGYRAPAGLVARGRQLVASLIAYYRQPFAWKALLITSVMLTYIGGAIMFWFHAVELGEGGPQISWYAHWLLDSTFAFIGLTPALLLIMPFGAWAANRIVPNDNARLPWIYVAITGLLFALVTVPGPVAHDLIVGRGTWIATKVTDMIGDPSAPLAPAVDYPLVGALSQQLGFGVPVYLLMSALSVMLVRAMMGRRQVRRTA